MLENTYVTGNRAIKRSNWHQINVMDVLIATATSQFLYTLMYSHLQVITRKVHSYVNII